MSTAALRMSVSFDEGRLECIDKVCVERAIDRTAIIRSAIDEFVERKAQSKVNLARIAVTSEFAQIGIDILICQLPPSQREDLLATLAERMELYGAVGRATALTMPPASRARMLVGVNRQRRFPVFQTFERLAKETRGGLGISCRRQVDINHIPYLQYQHTPHNIISPRK